jgi:peptidoglycan/LPS O-acetylase OafA/YrhL
MHSAPHGSATRLDVQVLRGVAVALVVAAHAFGVPRGGWLGVDVFFVLSGFVITRSLVAERERSGRIDLVRFAARRIRRLLPAAAVVLVATTALSWAFWYRPRASTVSGDAIAALLGSMNWHLARNGTDYFADDAASPFQHFWSLSVEEQFYAVWPVVLVVLSTPAVRRLRHGRLVAVAALTVAALGFALAAGPLEGPVYFSTWTRAWELLLGATCALLPAPGWSRRTAAWIRAVGAVAVVGGIGAAAATLLPTVPVAVGTAALLVAGDLRPRGGLLGACTGAWAALGGISYSAYLWHWPLLVVAAAALPGPVGASIAVVLALALATASTRWVERPFLAAASPRSRRRRHGGARSARNGGARSTRNRVADDRGARAGRRRLVLVAPVTVLVVSASTATAFDPATAATAAVTLGPTGLLNLAALPGAAGTASNAAPVHAGSTEPFADRSALARAVGADDPAAAGSGDGTAALAAAARRAALPAAMQDGGCLVTVGAPLRTCGSTSGVDVLLLGDSTTTAWSPTVIGALPTGTTHAVVGVASCSAVLPDRRVADRWDAACLATKRALHARVAELDPRVVVISSVTGEYREHLGDLPDDEAREHWERSLAQTVAELRDGHRSVVVLGAPQYGPDVRSCPDRLSGFARCATPPTPDAVAKTAAERSAAEHGRFPFVDGASWLCDAERRSCPAVIDGTLVRVDQVHTTRAMAERLVPLMRSAVDWDGLLTR